MKYAKHLASYQIRSDKKVNDGGRVEERGNFQSPACCKMCVCTKTRAVKYTFKPQITQSQQHLLIKHHFVFKKLVLKDFIGKNYGWVSRRSSKLVPVLSFQSIKLSGNFNFSRANRCLNQHFTHQKPGFGYSRELMWLQTLKSLAWLVEKMLGRTRPSAESVTPHPDNEYRNKRTRVLSWSRVSQYVI